VLASGSREPNSGPEFWRPLAGSPGGLHGGVRSRSGDEGRVKGQVPLAWRTPPPPAGTMEALQGFDRVPPRDPSPPKERGESPLKAAHQPLKSEPLDRNTAWLAGQGEKAADPPGLKDRYRVIRQRSEELRHRRFPEAFALGHRLGTNCEHLEFMAEGGYSRSELWRSERWSQAEEEGWRERFCREERNGEWWHFTPRGMTPLDLREPVCHANWYEADSCDLVGGCLITGNDSGARPCWSPA